MKSPVWFNADKKTCDKVATLKNRTIFVRAVLPDGLTIEGVGGLWTRVNGARTRAAVTVAFEYTKKPFVLTQTMIHLGKSQLTRIGASTRKGADFEYQGDLRPRRIPVAGK